MAIEVRHDSGQGLAANMQSAVQSRAQNLRRQQSGEVAQPRPPSVPGSLVQGTQPGEPRLGPAQQAMIAFEAGNITDSFNSWLDAFDAYEIPPDQKGRFESTWRELMADPGLTHEQRMAGLTQVLERAQVMVDSSPRKRDRRQEWLESLRENPSPFVIDPQSGEMIANPFEQQRRIETREERLQQGVEIREQAEARQQQALALRQQQQEEAQRVNDSVIALREQTTEYRRLQTERLEAIEHGDPLLRDRMRVLDGSVSGRIRRAERAATHSNTTYTAATREVSRLSDQVLQAEGEIKSMLSRLDDPTLPEDLRVSLNRRIEIGRLQLASVRSQRNDAQERRDKAEGEIARAQARVDSYEAIGGALAMVRSEEEMQALIDELKEIP